MWPLTSQLLAGSLVVTLEEIVSAMQLLVERTRTVAEGAGAASVVAAFTCLAGESKVVCVVSGGNIDARKLTDALRGRIPMAH
jgi:threonine dehydratase